MAEIVLHEPILQQLCDKLVKEQKSDLDYELIMRVVNKLNYENVETEEGRVFYYERKVEKVGETVEAII